MSKLPKAVNKWILKKYNSPIPLVAADAFTWAFLTEPDSPIKQLMDAGNEHIKTHKENPSSAEACGYLCSLH